MPSRHRPRLPGLGRPGVPQPCPQGSASGMRGGPGGRARAWQPGGRAPEGSCWPLRPVSRYRPRALASVRLSPDARASMGMGDRRGWGPCACCPSSEIPEAVGHTQALAGRWLCPGSLVPELGEGAEEKEVADQAAPSGCNPLAHLSHRRQPAKAGAGGTGSGAPGATADDTDL